MKNKNLTIKDRSLILGIAILFFFGILFFGQGITGMYLLDFEKDFCSETQDCPGDYVCCGFYEENYGICEHKVNCAAIKRLTKEEKERVSSDLGFNKPRQFTEEDKQTMLKTLTTHMERPQSKSPYPSIITGGILLLLGIIWIIYLKRGDN